MLEQFEMAPEDQVRVDEQTMRTTVEAVFCALGLSQSDARQSADVLLYADCMSFSVRTPIAFWER